MIAQDWIDRIVESGWLSCDSVRAGVLRAGLPLPTAEYLAEAFTEDQWAGADRAVVALREHFRDARFADTTEFGVLLVATVTGAAGPHLGSDDTIRADDPASYTVGGVDTRELMVRQIWGARVLQAGAEPPDSEIRGAWTFTVLPGEDRVDGQAVSGTVLHSTVRFRLGRADRGIAVVRAAPALVIGSTAA